MNDYLQTLLICFFAFMGPIVGIQIQKYIERKQAIQQRKADILRTLLTFQQDKASPECAKALNLLLVDFSDAAQTLRNAIEDYKNHLQNYPDNKEDEIAWNTWQVEQNIKFDTLLKEVAENYDKSLIVDKQFKTFNYIAQRELDKKTEEQFIRKELCNILTDKKLLKIAVTNFPPE